MLTVLNVSPAHPQDHLIIPQLAPVAKFKVSAKKLAIKDTLARKSGKKQNENSKKILIFLFI